MLLDGDRAPTESRGAARPHRLPGSEPSGPYASDLPLQVAQGRPPPSQHRDPRAPVGQSTGWGTPRATPAATHRLLLRRSSAWSPREIPALSSIPAPRCPSALQVSMGTVESSGFSWSDDTGSPRGSIHLPRFPASLAPATQAQNDS